jgi:DNA-directed RNA polymerase specialized sigma subunit
MNKKEYLSQALFLDKRIKAKERQLDWLKDHAVYVSPQISDMPNTPRAHRSAMEEAVVKIVDLETEISNGISQLVQLKSTIAGAIRSINSMECETLLEMRYLTFMSWEEIAAQLGYSQSYIYHLHRKALSLLKGHICV